MIYKICEKCKSTYEYGKACPNGCEIKKKKADNKFYDKYKRKNKEIYHSKQWMMTRQTVLAMQDYICLYTFFKYGKIIKATLVHHIIELNDDKSLAYDLENLIAVCNDAHNEIHNRYKKEKKETQKELKNYLKIYKGRGL